MLPGSQQQPENYGGVMNSVYFSLHGVGMWGHVPSTFRDSKKIPHNEKHCVLVAPGLNEPYEDGSKRFDVRADFSAKPGHNTITNLRSR